MSIDYQYHRSVIVSNIHSTEDQMEAFKALNGATSDSDAVNRVNSVVGFNIYSQSAKISNPDSSAQAAVQSTSSEIELINSYEAIGDLNSLTTTTKSSTVNAINEVNTHLNNLIINIEDGTVTSAKIADSAITSDKIADNAVTSAKIAVNTIIDSNIAADAAISFSKLAMGSWTMGASAYTASSGPCHTSPVLVSAFPNYSGNKHLISYDMMSLPSICGTCYPSDNESDSDGALGCIKYFVNA